MKTLSLNYMASEEKGVSSSSATEYMLLTLIAAFALCIWCFCGSAQASSLPARLSLLRFHADSGQPEMLEGENLSRRLRQEARKPRINHLAKQTNLELNNTLRGLAKSAKINITPQVVMKPFFLVQEVKNALYVFQTRHLKKQIQIDQNFQARTLYSAKELSFMQEVKKKKPLLFSPCESRIYGIHVQFNFK